PRARGAGHGEPRPHAAPPRSRRPREGVARDGAREARAGVSRSAPARGPAAPRKLNLELSGQLPTSVTTELPSEPVSLLSGFASTRSWGRGSRPARATGGRFPRRRSSRTGSASRPRFALEIAAGARQHLSAEPVVGRSPHLPLHPKVPKDLALAPLAVAIDM